MKKKVFISHSSEDAVLMQSFSNLLDKIIDNPSRTVFNTFTVKYGTTAGDERSKAIKDALSASKAMIAVITESYLRSIICISELSSCWLNDIPIIPIIFCSSAKEIINNLFGKDIIYISAFDNKPEKSAKSLTGALKKYKITMSKKCSPEAESEIFFTGAAQAKSVRPYIGCSPMYNDIIKYCAEFGITKLQNSNFQVEEMSRKLEGKKHIYILSATGNSLINSLSSAFLPNALCQGVNFTIILPNKYSDFCNDVAEIESPENSFSNKQRLSNEFDNVMSTLLTCIKNAYNKCGQKSIGHIYVACAYTMLRQTVTLALDNENNIWGYISMTLPPKKTIDGTPSLEFYGQTNKKSIAKAVYEHIISIINIAESRGGFFEITHDSLPIQYFKLENENARSYWEKQFIKARQNMSMHYNSSTVLIEVAAQHPLTQNGKPNTEFAARLDYAIKLYNELHSEQNEVFIYVPGSLHQYKGVTDTVSLSNAGVSYLYGNGIPKNNILGESENIRYKGSEGVYNSADECYTASQIFLNGNFKTIHCVCSPNQMMRKKLFYLAFGVLPHFHTVPCDYMFHNDLDEIFETIPDVIFRDHTWQDKDSPNGRRTRDERMPKID